VLGSLRLSMLYSDTSLYSSQYPPLDVLSWAEPVPGEPGQLPGLDRQLPKTRIHHVVLFSAGIDLICPGKKNMGLTWSFSLQAQLVKECKLAQVLSTA
jgi:hypothetical protein